MIVAVERYNNGALRSGVAEGTQNLWYAEHLACPDCKAELAATGEAWLCPDCARSFAGVSPLTLLPSDPKSRALNFTPLRADPRQAARVIAVGPPAPAYFGPMPGRDSRELLSAVVAEPTPPRAALDLGCGPRDQALCFAHLGCHYVGLDTPGTAADIWGDAHFLPFRAGAFDVVFAYAVLEHLYNPFLALAEVRKVLRSGGLFVGVVSQGEPFHDSFFHMTPWALVALAEASGLLMERLWAGPDTLAALSRMGGYPRVIRALLGAVGALDRAAPFLAPRRMRRSDSDKRFDALCRAGSIGFTMRRPAD